MIIKVCIICGNSFEARISHQITCSAECRKENKKRNNAEYRQAHKEEHRRYAAEYRQAHKEELRRQNAEWYQAHKEERRRYDAEYRQAHKEEHRRYAAEWYQAHKEELRLENAKWYRRNRGKILPRRYILRKLKGIDEGRKVKPFCHTCGKKFTPTYQGEKYCSNRCRLRSPLWQLWLRIRARLGY